jgi:predicted nucleic acid-binding protein
VSGWLFDTNVLSALAPGRLPLSPAAIKWFEGKNEELFFSAITVTEIDAGIAKLQRAGSTRRSEILQTWFTGVLSHYGDRVLPFDLSSAHVAGGLTDVAKATGRHPGFADIAIGAIAKSRDLIVLTVNHRHFIPLGIETLNPLEQ